MKYPKIHIPDNEEEYRKPYEPDESNPVKRVCVDCGEILPVCYCDIFDDNRKDTI